jgi:transposase-like protein
MRQQHVGFWLDVDGVPVHVRGNPNMAPRTQEALAAMVRAFRAADIEATDEDDACPKCGSTNSEWTQSNNTSGYWRCLNCGNTYPASDEERPDDD